MINLYHKKRNNQGFTLVELLIVVVVIAILAAITIVAYNNVSANAHVASLKADLSQAATALANYRTDNSTWPGSATIGELKASQGNNFTYLPVADTYCLSNTDGIRYYYITNDNNVPQSGVCPATNGIAIQNVTTMNCPTTAPVRAVDSRDNHTYWVRKFSDGKCWMLTNLAYAGGGTNTYGDVKTINNGTGGSASYTVANYYVIPSTTNYTLEPALPSSSTDGGVTGSQYGYLYNWCAAMGAQATAACSGSATTPTPDPTITICPAGWRLPVGGSGGEFNPLNIAVNSGSTTTDVGLRTNWLSQRGGYWNNGFLAQGSDSHYWASTQAAAANANKMFFKSSVVYTVDNSYKNQGFAVRCVAN